MTILPTELPPFGGLRSPRGHLPLVAMDVAAEITGLLAGETAQIELVLTGPIPYDDGRAEYRFPLVVAPRYVPGTPVDGPLTGEGTALDTDLVPDASRITPPVLLPGQPNPVNLSLE